MVDTGSADAAREGAREWLGVKSAERVLEVLSFLARSDRPARAETIARECGVPRSSAYHLLQVMRAQRFVTYFAEEHAWGLGASAFEIGCGSLRNKQLEHLACPNLRTLAITTGEAAHVAVLHGDEVLYLAQQEPERPTARLVTAPGVRLPAHLTAIGRAMLMRLPPSSLSSLYASHHRLAQRHGRGPRHVRELAQVLAADRARGWAVETGTITDGISCVAAPVLSHGAEPVAAVNVTFLTTHGRGGRGDALAQAVLDVAERLSRALGWRH